MRAALVTAGVCTDVNEALQLIQSKRSICKTSSNFDAALLTWQQQRYGPKPLTENASPVFEGADNIEFVNPLDQEASKVFETAD
jgi:hypothetical protein